MKMNSTKYLLLAALLSQLSTCVFTETNVTEDAEQALNHLDSQIKESTILFVQNATVLWRSYVNNINETINQELLYDIGNFSALLQNLTKFASFISNGSDCLSGLDDYLDVDYYNIRVVDSQQSVYNNLFSLADTVLDYVVEQYFSMEQDFKENCVDKATDNCEGTSNFIVAEGERLRNISRRVPYDLLAEVHLLGYRLQIDWAKTQAKISTDYSKLVRIATTCLASKFQDYKEELLGTNLGPIRTFENVSEAYKELLNTSGSTYLTSLEELRSHYTNISLLNQEEGNSSVIIVRNAVFKANATVYSLLNVVPDLNITSKCTVPDVLPILSKAIKRALDESTKFGSAADIEYHEGADLLMTALKETQPIDFQVQECDSSMDCNPLSEKLNKKLVEIPLDLERKGNSTAVLQYQFVTVVRESRYKIVMDVFDQLEASIVALKDCARGSLYEDDLAKYTSDYLI